MQLFHLFVLLISTFLAFVHASSHSINVINKCGTPTTVQLPGIGIFGAGQRTINGDVRGGIAQACKDINGVGCASVEFTLVDGVSSADITLIPPHRFDVSFTLIVLFVEFRLLITSCPYLLASCFILSQ